MTAKRKRKLHQPQSFQIGVPATQTLKENEKPDDISDISSDQSFSETSEIENLSEGEIVVRKKVKRKREETQPTVLKVAGVSENSNVTGETKSIGPTKNIMESQSVKSRKYGKNICREWRRKGTCRRGKRCRYLHGERNRVMSDESKVETEDKPKNLYTAVRPFRPSCY